MCDYFENIDSTLGNDVDLDIDGNSTYTSELEELSQEETPGNNGIEETKEIDLDPFETEEKESENSLKKKRNNNSQKEDKTLSQKDMSFTGRYRCTCGCTSFADVGNNRCKCGHSWYNHKHWKD